MPPSNTCKVLNEIERNERYTRLKAELLKEFESEPERVTGKAYKQILKGVLDVLAKFEEFEDRVKLNVESLILIEDIATSGKCRYPWKVVKALLLLVYSKLFDEVYYSNKRAGEENVLPYNSRSSDYSNSPEVSAEEPEFERSAETEDDYKKVKLDSLVYILEFNLPPFTLQRLCEITLNQPYRIFKKLFNAYRKLFAVRNIEYEPEQLPPFLSLSEFPKLETVSMNIRNWERRYLTTFRPEWNEDLLSDNSDDADSSDERRFKRPRE
ncbi:hypothetical protein MACK_001292 [Theileria orientalis]|uniref:Uncharacterized protein n=1 Tax=Theileria orientalis TaxID=68886 RepID=A0A976MCS8_THEOR|nr:hypothetical protein MACK_001292 [Theileria orientalis]